MLNPLVERFAQKSPLTVMARGMMERVLNPEQLDQWFNSRTQEQYTRNLLFSSVFDLMSQVVCGSQPSIHAAYQASHEPIGVSITSVYNKLNGIETTTSAELVRYAAAETSAVEAGLGKRALASFPDAAAAAAAAPELVRAGDAVLVKGSRGMRLEAVVDALQARFGTGEA